jgi:hypothetical protein
MFFLPYYNGGVMPSGVRLLDPTCASAVPARDCFAGFTSWAESGGGASPSRHPRESGIQLHAQSLRMLDARFRGDDKEGGLHIVYTLVFIQKDQRAAGAEFQ